MASEIKVDNIKDQCGTAVITKCGATHTVTAEVYKANTIKDTSDNTYLSKCGSTVTLGGCGQTITLAAGASQSGFGRSGSVNWDTTAKTASPVTAVSGNGYFIDTTGGAITVNLPAGNAGDIVAISDYANTAATNNITIAPNGSEKIQGKAVNFVIDFNGGTTTLVYVDGTQGWKLTDAARGSDITEPALFTIATGGCVTTSGDYKIHTFTGPGTFAVTQVGNAPSNPGGGPNTVSYLVVAGGGSNGGGGGGYREGRDIGPSYTASPKVAPAGLTISQTCYPITVGAGGNASGPGTSPGTASKGSPSIFSTITSAGGGSSFGPAACSSNRSGGSGSGGNGSPQPVLAGNTPPVSPPQGNPGGTNRCGQSASGGGGAGAEGGGQGGYSGWPFPGPCQQPGGAGGAGVATSITGSSLSYSGGGGGAGNAVLGLGPGPASPCGTGGKGAGGPGPNTIPAADPRGATNGTVNRGGAGGAGGYGCGKGAGGSGIVVIRYKFQ